MAEALARRELESLGWSHVEVRSAGTGAADGFPASEGALRATAGNGLDLSGHRSAPVTPEVLEWADLVLTMSTSHLLRIVALGYGDKAALLTSFAAGDAADGAPDNIQDPFGGSDEVYEETLHLLDRLVQQALRRLEPILAP
jgi:protein-tyrosine phosphatase